MLQFDTLKIAFPTLLIKSINPAKLTAYSDDKYPEKLAYYRADIVPGLIAVRIGIIETTIEFSAKILKAGYPLLISTATIQVALSNAIHAAPFTVKVRKVLRLAHVLKAHQTLDFALTRPFAAYALPLANLHVSRDYRPVPYKDETLTYLQNATGPGREFWKIYDKAKEYARPTNAAYRETLTANENRGVEFYYSDKMRGETEINGKRKLRQAFPDIHGNIMLTDLLNSTANPLAKQFAKITKSIYAAIDNPTQARALAFAETLSFDDLETFSHLEKHGFKLAKIDAHMKEKQVPKATQHRKRKKYAALLASYLAHQTDSSAIACLRELRAAIMAPTYCNSYLESGIEPITSVAAPAITIATEESKMEPTNQPLEKPYPAFPRLRISAEHREALRR